MKQLWDIWPELTVYNKDSRTTFIQTPDEKWGTYFSIWRRAMIEDKETDCPCPMPQGHLMFKDIKAPTLTDQKQSSLPFGKLSNGNPIRTKATLYDTRKLSESEFKDLCLQYPEQGFRRGYYLTQKPNIKYMEKMVLEKSIKEGVKHGKT